MLYAWLAERYRLTRADIGALTPAYIAAVYLPVRDKDGHIRLDAGAESSAVDVAAQDRYRRFRLGLPRAAEPPHPPQPAD